MGQGYWLNPRSSVTRRLLAVHAHPDDESSKGAATYARYTSLGDEVLVVSCTGGERGDVQNPALVEQAMAERDMAGLRRREMQRAQELMGIQHLWLGYQDSGLPDEGDPVEPGGFALVPLELSAAPLVRIIRRFRPHVLVTYDEAGGYPHPDHIRTHEISMYAMRAAADADRYPHLGEPWQVQKVYYDRIFNGPRIRAVHESLVDDGDPLADEVGEMVEWMGDRPDLATTHVDVGDFLEVRDAALRAHASQVAPDSRFFFLPNDTLRAAWPWDDFQLVESTVATTLPESDLFAGITPDDALPEDPR
jgi:mycothiol S-conjugate amidase